MDSCSRGQTRRKHIWSDCFATVLRASEGGNRRRIVHWTRSARPRRDRVYDPASIPSSIGLGGGHEALSSSCDIPPSLCRLEKEGKKCMATVRKQQQTPTASATNASRWHAARTVPERVYDSPSSALLLALRVWHARPRCDQASPTDVAPDACLPPRLGCMRLQHETRLVGLGQGQLPCVRSAEPRFPSLDQEAAAILRAGTPFPRSHPSYQTHPLCPR